MGKGPISENNNVYFKARKRAALYNERLYSREGASELLGVSVSTLADYELGNTKVVPVDKVVLMAEMCNDSRKRQEMSRVTDNSENSLVQIWYRKNKKAPDSPLECHRITAKKAIRKGHRELSASTLLESPYSPFRSQPIFSHSTA